MRLRLLTLLAFALLPLDGAFGEQNGIDWQPWSDSAFAQAKREGRFVILNLGAVWVSLVPCDGRHHLPGSEGDRVDSLTLRRRIGR
jgi:hypothetical protein